MNRTKLLVPSLMLVLAGAFVTQLWAYPEYARKTRATCAACHANPAGGADLTPAGQAYKADNAKVPQPAAKSAQYVGNDRCRVCHSKIHKSYLETPHAKAWATIAAADAKQAAEISEKLNVKIKGSPVTTDDCVRCHVTGFQLPGGYPQTDATKATAVTNVGCESCHGPGSAHVSAPSAEKKKFIAMPTEATCKQCHVSQMSPNFNFAEYRKRGVHAVSAAK